MKITAKLESILFSLKSRFSTTHRIKNITLDTPRGFVLEKYQAKHKLYDRFLPVLAKELPNTGLVVDVGANIGDTTIAMIQENACRYHCYEPSAHFYAYLLKNVQKLPEKASQKVHTYPYFIGTGSQSGTLVYSHEGTARLDFSSEGSQIQFHTLDTLLADEQQLSLIKCDTDGFDFDVLLSGLATMKQHQPLLFWENEIYSQKQYDGYLSLYVALEQLGYKHFYVFDNYGGLLLEGTSIDALIQLSAYMYHAKFKGGTQTFYYVDILAATDENKAIADAAINQYKNLYINK